MNKVYLVDDDEKGRDSLAFLLDAAGLSVQTYDNANDFMTSCSTDARGCLVMEANMPVIDGTVMLKELQTKRVPLPVILFSAVVNIPLTVLAIKAGAMDFLIKPVDPAVLLHRIHSAFEHQANLLFEAGRRKITFSRLENLTEREKEVMMLAVSGIPNKEIARQLGISHRTVEIHRSRVMQKTGSSSLLELARFAAEFAEH